MELKHFSGRADQKLIAIPSVAISLDLTNEEPWFFLVENTQYFFFSL